MRLYLSLVVGTKILFLVGTALAQSVQPVFQLPLELGSQAACLTGNNDDSVGGGVYPHSEALRKHALDFEDNGALVVAAADGIAFGYGGCVDDGNCNQGFGNHIKIAHGPSIYSLYAELNDVLVESGARVRRGEVIGTIGNSGNSSTPNLHFAVHPGDAQSLTSFPASISIKNLVAIDQDDAERGGAQFLPGADFVCNRRSSRRHVYLAVSAPSCTLIQSGSDIPAGYAPPYNVFSSKQELLIDANCTPGRTVIALGNNDEDTFVYDKALVESSGGWEEVTVQCFGQRDGEYCVGGGIAEIGVKDGYVAAYFCQNVNGTFKCGCGDQGCTEPKWSIQYVDTGSSASLASTNSIQSGAPGSPELR